MNGRNLVLDSNIVIYLSKKSLELRSFKNDADTLFISIITYMEVWGFDFSSDDEKLFIEAFCKAVNIIQIDEEIVEKVIEIRQRAKIKLPDAIIAATGKILKGTLVTRNTDDFSSLKDEIILLNPFTSPAD